MRCQFDAGSDGIVHSRTRTWTRGLLSFFLVLLDGLAGLSHSYSNKWRLYDWIVFGGTVRLVVRKSIFCQSHDVRAARMVLSALQESRREVIFMADLGIMLLFLALLKGIILMWDN